MWYGAERAMNNLLFYLIDEKIEQLNREHYNMKDNEDLRLIEINYWNYIKDIIIAGYLDESDLDFEDFYNKSKNLI